MIKGLGLLAWASFALAVPAHAEYVFDSADLPESFACDEDWDAARCTDEARFEAWYEKYGGAYGYWFDELLFNTNVYFADKAEAIPLLQSLDEEAPNSEYETLGRETPNLVDVTYSIALRPFSGWAFAIDEKAQLRLVRMRAKDEIDPKLAKKFESALPTSLAATAEAITIGAAWEEADLTQCKGAIAHLLDFPAQKPKQLWDEEMLEWAPSYKPRADPDYLIVTADGDGVLVRARAITNSVKVDDEGKPYEVMSNPPFVIYNQSNRGAGYDWALEMEKIIGACLKPSATTPPWEKVLAANPSAPESGEPTTPE
ncbi:MAG: hypothetical protein ABJP70_02385 [Erythrobacter sp.]